MLRIHDVEELMESLSGPGRSLPWDPALEERVREILESVHTDGDAAVAAYGQMFDGVRLSAEQMPVGHAEFAQAREQVSSELMSAMEKAVSNLRDFHRREVPRDWWQVRDDGSVVGQRVTPLRRVGLYIPGGRASYASSLLMTAVPAQTAGVDEILVCSPPDREGSVSPAVLAAADLLGIDRVFRIGGAQAIAAMAFGTETVPPVDMIAGPGNVYVTAAKKLVYGTVDIDSLAGPTELVVMCDRTADPAAVAADLLAQAEHDPEARVFLLVTCDSIRRAVCDEIEGQLPEMERSEIARQSLEHRSAAVVAREDNLWRLIDVLAPEHLSLQTAEPLAMLHRVRNAGAIFLGGLSALSFGDYTSGLNHVLPTGGTARFASPLGVESFVKRSNVLMLSRQGFEDLAGATEVFAEAEGLPGHARAVSIRREDSC